jgi:adenosylcobinamide kinase / adenosylcobinamide-phosphate guanylyltransferase
MTVFITGPLRSGKSEFAKRLASARGGPVVFVATARVDPADAEFVARVERHKRDRPGAWTTLETGGAGRERLLEVILQTPAGTTVVVDSLGSWLAGFLIGCEADAERDPAGTLDALETAARPLAELLAGTRTDVIVVSEETGWSLVPTTPLGRIFSDALGRLNRAVATSSGAAYVVIAGYALDLKTGRPVSS